ncbi:hypothetical protein GTP46_18785 [Duganella sp. FT135W]|uniref:DUF1640 domain-containing protein n=1 Tax=Duganella flavida TaxID=2692175 RepID=A0A6L8KFX1_9BURK|nr:hypothetical protein [Duganella flavida]MYM24684.1 hypothetical protein [Duganella flavida]
MNALAQLDNGNRAAEDEEMDTAIDLLRQDMGARFDEGNARIADSHKEAIENTRLVEAQIDELRRETTARIEALARETTGRFDALFAESRRSADRSDVQFRWLVSLIAATLLGMASLLVKTGHW